MFILVNPTFQDKKWGSLDFKLHGHVNVMVNSPLLKKDIDIEIVK